MEVDRDVIRVAPQPSAQREVGSKPGGTAPARRDDDLVEKRIVLDNRRGSRLDDVGEVSVRKSFAKRANGGRRENDVTNLPKANEQDLQSIRFDGRFIDEHDRDVILDGIDAVTLGAFERGPAFDQSDGGFAVRTRQYFE